MNLTPDIAKHGVKEGYFIQIDELIEPNMPNYVEKMKDYIPLTVQTDGHIYSIPTLNECYHCQYLDKLWMNSYKLEQLGLKEPQTIQELYDVCEAYLKADPNNVCFGDISEGKALRWIMNSFILTPNDEHSTARCIISPDGKIVSAAATEQYKEGLKWLKKFYDLGALYEGNFSNTTDSLRTLINQDGEPVLFFVNNTSSGYIDSTADNEMYRHYEVLSPVEGPDGTRQTPYYKYDGLYEDKFVITDRCRYPEAALRLCDWFFTDNADLMSQYGAEEGVDWVRDPEGKVGINGKPALYEIYSTYSNDVQNHDWQNASIRYAPNDYRLGAAMDADADMFTAPALEKLLYEETKNKQEPYAQKAGSYDIMPNLHLTAEETSEISVPLVEVTNYISENLVMFVTGKKDIDADWDKYIAGFDNLGLPTLLQVYQTAYDR